MTSSPLDSTHGRQRQAWHDIISIGQHIRSDDVERGMTSPPFDSTHCQTTSGVAYHHRLCAAHTVERHWAWHDITALGLHARSDDVGCGMTSPPLDRTHGRQRRAWHDITALGQHTRSATSCVACHHRFWTSPSVERRQAWHAIIAFGQHKRSNDVGRGMTSPRLDCTHGLTT